MKYWQRIILDHGLVGIKALIHKKTYKTWLALEIVRIYRDVPRYPKTIECKDGTKYSYLATAFDAFDDNLNGLPKLNDKIR